MRIAHVYRDLLSDGGVPHQTRQLLRAQAALGHEILIVSADSKVPLTGTMFPCPVRYAIIGSGLSSHIEMFHALKSFRADIIHVTAISIPIQELWIRKIRAAGYPYVLSPHGLLAPLGMTVRFRNKATVPGAILAKKIFRRLFDLRSLESAAAIHAQSSFEQELLASLGFARTFIAPMGVDDEWIANSRKPLPSTDKPITFGYLGHLDMFHKGLDLIARASSDLISSGFGDKFRLLLAGAPVKASTVRLVKMLHDLRVLNVDFRGPTWGKEKVVFWQETDWFLNVFRFAGMARATGEAIGKAIPVLSSREGNWGDWICQLEAGWVVDLEVGSVARAMLNAINCPTSIYNDMRSNAKLLAQSLSWRRIAEFVVEGYEFALTRSHPAPTFTAK